VSPRGSIQLGPPTSSSPKGSISTSKRRSSIMNLPRRVTASILAKDGENDGGHCSEGSSRNRTAKEKILSNQSRKREEGRCEGTKNA